MGDSQLADRVDYDEYDAKVFRNPLTHSTLKGWAPGGTTFRRIRSALDMQRVAKSKEEPIFRRVSSPPRGVSSYEDMEISASFSTLTVIHSSFYCILDLAWLKFSIYGITLCGKVWKKNGKMFTNVPTFSVNRRQE